MWHPHRTSVPATLALSILLATTLWLAAPATADQGVGSNPQFFGQAGDTHLFLANPGGNRPFPCLWRTDGTTQGTYELPDCLSPTGNYFTAELGDLFFLSSRSSQVVVTDGTAGGTRPITNFVANTLEALSANGLSRPPSIVVTGDDGVHGKEPWVTDGTVAGTRLVADLEPGKGDSQAGYLGLGDRLLIFLRDDAGTPTLWRSGLTPETTEPFTTLPEDERVFWANRVGDVAVFWLVQRDGDATLWRTDLTPQGTRPLRQFQDFLSTRGTTPRTAGGHAYFQADGGDGFGPEVWRTDGDTVERVTDFPAAPVDRELFPREFRGQIYFPLDGGPEVGVELFKTGGTPETTRLVRDVCPGPCSGYSGLFVRPLETESLGSVLLFPTDDGTDGRELWVSDGTAAGTRLLRDLCPGACDAEPAQLTTLGDELITWADDGVGGREIWRVNLVDASAEALTDFTPELQVINLTWARLDDERLLFSADDGIHGSELWVTDGTPEGTRLFLELAPEPGPVSELPAPPDRPSGLALEDGYVGLTWTPGTGGGRPESFAVEMRSPDTDGWTTVATLPGDAYGQFNWSSSLEPDTPYTFRVIALNQAGASPPGAEINLKTSPKDGACDPVADLCLDGGRYRVEVDWRNGRVSPAKTGPGRPVAAATSDRSGYFWFFKPDNVELIVKVLDGTPLNGHRWVFYGALSDVEYWLTVTDLEAAQRTVYRNPPTEICGRGDTTAFRALPTASGIDASMGAGIGAGPVAGRLLSLPGELSHAPAEAAIEPGADAPTTPCAQDATTLCLLDGRYAVTVEWHDQHNDRSGVGAAVPYANRTGFFWFFREDNIELVVKILDGTPVNGKTWVFYGALTDVEYTLTVTDTATGHDVETYVNEPGNICGGADTAAF